MPETDAIEFITGQKIDGLNPRVAWELSRAISVQRGDSDAHDSFDEILGRVQFKIEGAAKSFACIEWPADIIVCDLKAKLWTVVRNYRFKRGASLLSLIDRAMSNFCIQERRKFERRIRPVGELDDEAEQFSGAYAVTEQGFATSHLRLALADLSDDAQLLAAFCIENGEMPAKGFSGWGDKRRSNAKSEVACLMSQWRSDCDGVQDEPVESTRDTKAGVT